MAERRGPGAPRSFTREMVGDAVDAVRQAGEPVVPKLVIRLMKERSGLTRTPREDAVQDDIDAILQEREDERVSALVEVMPRAAIEAADAAMAEMRRRLLMSLADQRERLAKQVEARVEEIRRRLRAADEANDRLQEQLAAERDAFEEVRGERDAATAEMEMLRAEIEEMRLSLARREGEDAFARRIERLLQGEGTGPKPRRGRKDPDVEG